jgi:hypothetical protein
MSLQDKLDHIRRQFESKAPQEALTVMHRATEDLYNSGIMDRVLKAGDQAPRFTLPDENGNMVAASDLWEKGPLVVSIYRGVW